jgi:hypothetical protein
VPTLTITEPKFLPLIRWPHEPGDEHCVTIRSDLVHTVTPAKHAEPRCGAPFTEWPYSGSSEWAVQFELYGILQWGVTCSDNLRAAGVAIPEIYSAMRRGNKYVPSSAQSKAKH